VFPTDTVYGIGCSALQAESVARVFAAKHRDSSKPLPVFIGGLDQVVACIDPAELPAAFRLAEVFWPGPLTIVVDVARSGLHVQPPPFPEATSVGFRVPRHAGLLRLLRRGLALAQTSFNESGEAVVESLEAPGAAALLKYADVVLDSRQQPAGRPSTLVRLLPGSWSMVREGDVSALDVSRALSLPYP
jgi:L-threonylcarbamoyladenylate synthase